jgi:peptide alpha-N-acetyltransferase
VDPEKAGEFVDGIIGVVICRLEPHKSGALRGYIGMLAVHDAYRHQGIGAFADKQNVFDFKDHCS